MKSKKTSVQSIPIHQKPAKLFDWVNTTAYILLSLLVVYPFYQCVVLAFSNAADITLHGIPYGLPRSFSLESFRFMLQNDQFLTSIVNSVARTLSGSILSVLVSSCFAFALSHSKLKLRGFYVTLGIVSMYFGGGLVPTFLVIRDLGLYNNFLVYILPGAFSMYYAMIFTTSFRNVPKELEESATIDGANDVHFFFRILVPVSKPVIACILLFSAVGHWNAYYDCMIYTNDDRLQVLASYFARIMLTTQYIEQRIVEQANAGASGEELMAMRGPISSLTTQMAAMVLTVSPILCLYPFLQRYFVHGIMIGSVKG